MQERTSLISVIITTYKRPTSVLQRAVESVLAQTYQRLELVVVNDSPEDAELCQQNETMLCSFNDERIHSVVHPHNLGACKARNTGLAHSRGEFIAFLDDDDTWLPEKLDHQLQAFKSFEIAAVTCHSLYYAEGATEPEIVRVGKGAESLIEALLRRNCVGGCSQPLIRRSALEAIGGFDESMPASQDYDVWMRLAQKFDIVFLDEALVKRYYSADAITVNYDKKMKGFEIFQTKNDALYQQYPKALNYRYAQKVHFCFAHRHIGDGFHFWKEAIKTLPLSKYNFVEPLKGIVKSIQNRQ